MQRFLHRFIHLVEWWAVILLVLMVTVVSLGVFFRYVLESALVWYDEFASYLLVWLTFYGAVVASYRQRHIRFELVVDRFDPKARKIVDMIGECLGMGFQSVLFYYGWQLMQKMGDETAISLVWVKMSWVYSVLPITGGLMLLVSLARLAEISLVKAGRRGEQTAWNGSSSE